jgi:hypothetical protein
VREGEEAGPEEQSDKSCSFESEWIFWFLHFVRRLDCFLRNGRWHSHVPDAFVGFLSSRTGSCKILVLFLRSTGP